MKLLTSIDINSKFTYFDVRECISNFWFKNVIIYKNYKIWLTIKVTNDKKVSFTLIKNLPFDTSGYKDVFVVLEQIFNDNLLINRNDKLINITFLYKYDNKYSKYNLSNINIFKYKMLKNVFIYVLFSNLFLIVVLIYFGIIDYNLLILSNIHLNEVYCEFSEITGSYIVTESISCVENNSIFGNFFDLFSKSSNCYFPSFFINDNKMEYESKDFSLREYIYLNHFILIDKNSWVAIK